MHSRAHPEHLRELAGIVRRDVATTAKLVGSPADAPSALRVPLTGRRRVAWSTPLPLAEIKEAGHRRAVTINDLLLTALAASLHEVLERAGLPDEIHTMVPFNLRALDEPVPAELGNDFALILLELPVGNLAPAERLREVSSRMEKIKDSHEAPIAYGIVGGIGLTPPWLEDRLIASSPTRQASSSSNVPGPRRQLHFPGFRWSGSSSGRPAPARSA